MQASLDKIPFWLNINSRAKPTAGSSEEIGGSKGQLTFRIAHQSLPEEVHAKCSTVCSTKRAEPSTICSRPLHATAAAWTFRGASPNVRWTVQRSTLPLFDKCLEKALSSLLRSPSKSWKKAKPQEFQITADNIMWPIQWATETLLLSADWTRLECFQL